MIRRGARVGGAVVLLLVGGGAGGEPTSAHSLPAGGAADATDPPHYRLVEDESLLAIVTRRAGPAARLAHDHLVHAAPRHGELRIDPGDPATARFALTVSARDLVADDDDTQRRWEGRLEELGILDGPFQSIGERDRARVRSEMLAEGQLHAAEHPRIVVETGAIRPVDDGAFPWEVDVRMEVRGVTHTVPARARIESDGNRIRVEAHGAARFTDFEIEPYSAFLGAVRNQDRFFLYVSIVAEPDEEADLPAGAHPGEAHPGDG